MRQLFIVFFTFLTLSVFAQEVKTKLQLSDFISTPNIKNASVSIYVTDADGNELLASSPQLCVTPASTLKLITTATALQLMGGDFTFKTIIWIDGTISDSILSGNLVITGGGDPTLGSELFTKSGDKKKFLTEWVHSLKLAGIDSISGNIIVDSYIFSDHDIPQTWIWEDIGNYYGAAARGIALYDNTFELIFNTSDTLGEKTEVVKIIPEVPGLILRNEVVSSAENRDNAYVFGSPYDSFRLIKGTLPAGRYGFSVKASIPDPAILLASEVKKALEDSLIKVAGIIESKKVTDIGTIAADKKIIEWSSPSLSEIIEKLNHESINLYAEHLCKYIGLVIKGNGTTSDGVAAIKEFWTARGIDTENLFLADGSGLSRFNALTAKTLVDVLSYIRKNSQWYDAYLKSIPLTGLQGTQKYYFQNSYLKGKVHVKTGSMTRVRSFAGYMTTQSGKEISFAIIINNFNGSSSSIARQMEKFVESLYMKL